MSELYMFSYLLLHKTVGLQEKASGLSKVFHMPKSGGALFHGALWNAVLPAGGFGGSAISAEPSKLQVTTLKMTVRLEVST